MNRARPWLSAGRSVVSSVVFVLGLGLFFGEEESRQLGAALLGLSYVVARGSPWPSTPVPVQTSTATRAVLPVVLCIAALAVFERLDSIASGVSATAHDVSSIGGGVSSIESDVSDMRGDVSSIQSETSRIRSDVSSIESETSSIGRDVSSIHARGRN